MYADLLPLMWAARSAKVTVEQVVAALTVPQPRALGEVFAGVDRNGPRRPVGGLTVICAEKTTCREKMTLAGTDMLGFCLPPNGCGGFGAPARTNVRYFHLPPDLAVSRLATLEGIDGPGPSVMMREVSAGMDVRWFLKPPDRMTDVLRQKSMLSFGLVGTEV